MPQIEFLQPPDLVVSAAGHYCHTMPLNIKDELHRKLIIAVDGVAPGVGKTTVMRHVVASLIGRGTDVMAFAEEDVLTHPALADVAHEFAAVGRVSPETLLDASAQYFRWFADAEEEVAVVDALFPFVASLLGWGRDEREIYAFTSRLRVLPGAESIRFVYLDADPRAALQRASAREANGWLEWLISTSATLRAARSVTSSPCANISFGDVS